MLLPRLHFPPMKLLVDGYSTSEEPFRPREISSEIVVNMDGGVGGSWEEREVEYEHINDDPHMMVGG